MRVRNRQGFVLIELLVVLFILALVAAVIMPVFTTPGDTLRKESGQIASTIRALYETSQSKKIRSTIEFNMDEQKVRWKTDSKNGSAILRTLIGVELQARGLVKKGQLIIFLDPSGNNEHMTIYFEDDKERMNVTFNPISGRTKINGPFNDE